MFITAGREGAEASKSGSFKDEREWGRRCFEDLDHRRMGRPATSTWSTDFLLREGSSREEIGKWLKNKSIPWQRRRGQTAEDKGNGSDAVDDTGVVSSQPTLAAGVEGRSGSVKEWKFQR